MSQHSDSDEHSGLEPGPRVELAKDEEAQQEREAPNTISPLSLPGRILPRTRDFSRANEPFLTIILAICGLIVAGASIWLAREANEISRTQTELAELQTKAAEAQTRAAERQARAAELQWTPQISFIPKVLEKWGTRGVEIVNTGAPLSNWDILEFDFLVLSISDEWDPVAVPCIYFGTHVPEDQTTKHVASLLPYPRDYFIVGALESNEEVFARIRSDLESTLRHMDRGFDLRLRHFLRVRYEDALREPHHELIALNDVFWGSPITHYPTTTYGEHMSAQISQLWENNWEKLKTLPIDGLPAHPGIEEFTAKALLKIWEMRKELEPLPKPLLY